ncbi:hypothetical protein AWW66_25375 [Micromonospora rosaria]|uniref:Uncharacterized protein n=1 Tax=Micromonospora rosaria TaxID=47874 RepID=A0A136PL91_9ACTN|nr:hypothetical protein [Micromonospora rosaria]KXK59240.1 hypothetical protein AWW66_25375 [Micromonospora rosaria]
MIESPVEPAEPARPARPATVTAAFWVQLALVAVLLLLVGLVAWYAVHWNGQIDRAVRLVPDADPDEVSGERISNVVTSSAFALPALLLAVVLAATAPRVRRGRNGARIAVLVAGGLQFVACLGMPCSGLLFLPFMLVGLGVEGEGPPFDETEWTSSRFSDELYGRVDPADDVFFGLGAAGFGLLLLLTIVVVLLLTLPPAGRYFGTARHAVAPVPYPLPGYPFPGAGYGLPTAPGGYPFPSGYGAPAAPAPAAGYGPPGYGTAPLAGVTVPPGYPVPPGYLICPDPALHLGRPPAPPAPPAEPSVTAPSAPPAEPPATVAEAEPPAGAAGEPPQSTPRT